MNSKFNRAVIFLNGDEKELSYTRTYINDQTLLVGCDGGTDKIHALGLKPNAVIGDFDSINMLPKRIKSLPKDYYGKEMLINDITYVKYPAEKDFLDVELAINFVLSKGLREMILVNTDGNELDHELGVVMILAKRKYRNLDIKIIRPKQKIYIARKKTVIKGVKGSKVSLIPLYGQARVESSSGLKYDPSKHRMSLQHNIGISNELTSKKATLNISRGCFLVVQRF